MTRQEGKRQRKQAARRERVRLAKHRRRMSGWTWQAPLEDDFDEPCPECGCYHDDGEEAEAPVPSSGQILGGRIATERLFYEMHAVIEERGLKEPEEINALLDTVGSTLEGMKSLRLTPDGPERQAQNLAFDAMETEDEERASELARRALDRDPHCVDALVILAHNAPSAQEGLAQMKAAVAVAGNSLGQDFIEEYRGHFWFTQGTRPYMRALEGLAFAFLENRRRQEACGVFEQMLDLNPNDNQGVRDLLLVLYLAEPAEKRLRDLLGRYEKDASSLFLWGRVFERFLANDLAGLESALGKAARSNPYVLPYLTGLKAPPEHSPFAWTPGRESEAQYCASLIAPIWRELFPVMATGARP